MFDKELKFFIDNQSKLVQQYAGKCLVLQGNSVVAAYDSALEAYTQSKKTMKLGSFMIQPCFDGADAYTVSISSANRIM